MDFLEITTSAIEALKTNKLRSALTSLGIIIGVASVVLLTAIGSGLRDYIAGQFEQLGSNTLFIIPGRIGAGGRGPGGTTINKLSQKQVSRIEQKVKNLDGVVPTIVQFTTIKYQNKTIKDVTITGTTYQFPHVVNQQPQRGQFFDRAQSDAGRKVAIIGQTVEEKIFAGKNPLGQKIDIKGSKYQVIGVAPKQGSTFGFDQDNVVVIPYEAASRQFGIDQVNNIYARAKNQADVEQVAAEIKKILLANLSEDDFSVLTASQTLATIQSILRTITLVLIGIAAISLIVGGIGIMNIMLVSVVERTREIGLRKAVGAKPSDILWQFLSESVILSFLGGLTGIVVASVITLIINRFIPAQITLWSVILATAFSTVVGIIFGVAPAIRAARLEPIVALRHE